MPERDDVSLRRSQLSATKQALLEKRLQRLRGKLTGDSKPPLIPQRPEPDRAPLSFAQQRLWFVEQLEPGLTAYNNPGAVRITGPLRVDVLERSLNEIVRRHQALRTTFDVIEGQRLQIIHPFQTSIIPLIDLREFPEEERDAHAQRWTEQTAQHSFDLAGGPLLRTMLLRLSEQEHIMVLVMHHIISDEWSLRIFVGELGALYEVFSAGRPSPLPDLPIQYGDFAHWQRQWQQGEVLENHLAYWKHHLAGAPPVLALPTDHPRPAMQSFCGASQSFSLAPNLSDALQALSRQEGVTLFMMLLAAFQTLLHRYTGQDDVVVSSGAGSRSQPSTEALIGCFINILLMRTNFAGDPPFRELLQQVRQVALEAYAHQDVPFELIVEALRPERDLSYNPLAQVMVVFLNVPAATIELRDLTLSSMRINRASAQFDLTLYMGEESDRLGGYIEYNTDLFEAPTVARMLEHFQVLLAGIVADPDRRISALPLLTDDERRQLLVDWNETRAEFPENACLHQLFEAQVERQPEATALIFEEEQYSFRELSRRANQLAHHLQTLGVGPEVRVGICLERSPEMVVSILGVLNAGGAYVPLDPAYPEERLAFMVANAQVPVVLTQQPVAERWADKRSQGRDGDPRSSILDLRLKLVCLDSNWSAGDWDGASTPVSAVRPENLAYMIYTSGSTGWPKAVAIAHRGVVNNLVDLNRRFAVGPPDRILALSSLSFDMCVYEVLGTLAAGGTIVMPGPEAAHDPAHWAEMMIRYGVTVWNSAPSLLEMFVDYAESRPEMSAYALRLALLGGDWIPVALPDRLKALVPPIQVISLGGATEASIHSTIYPIDITDPTWRSIPYGKPMMNQRTFVLDAHLQPVPVGVPGELYLAGVGLGRGYFHRPELTAERFLPDPFSGQPGDRMYKTGDLARYRADGNLELLGRIDFQVKIRGVRIELGEIEAALRQNPVVQDAVVLARPDGSGDKRLVGYVVFEPGCALTTTELQRCLKESLPDYMVPTAFVVLEALPLTPNGKVNRPALPSPGSERPRLEHSFIAPRTPVEEVLAGIWADVLGLERVGVHDNFFELGGHSLLATQVIARLQEVFPFDLPLRSLFRSPTIAELAAELDAMGREAHIDVAQIARVVSQLHGLSDDQVAAMLAERSTQR
jgi:amino acid adenylation domain-containing protein